MRGCNASLPRGGRTEGAQLLFGHHQEVTEERLDDHLVITLGQGRVHALFDSRRQGVHFGVRGRPSLVKHEPADVGGQRRRAERAEAAVRVAVDVNTGPGGLRDRVDHGDDVLELARQVVVRSVAAAAASAFADEHGRERPRQP